MAPELKMNDVVGLLEEVRTQHFSTGESLRLRRGQVGTVVMEYGESAVEVEFADRDGRTYALLPLSSERLMLLRDTPEDAVA